MFNLIFLLPQLFTVGTDIVKCIDGGTTKEEWDKTVEDMFQLVMSIPALQGYVALMQPLLMFSKIAFPFVESISQQVDDSNPEKPKMLAAKNQFSKEDLTKMYYSVKLLADVSNKFAEAKGVEKMDLTWEYKYYENIFDTGTFFDNQQVG